MKKSKQKSNADGIVTRLELPVRSKENVAEDSDSEAEDDDMSLMVERFKQITAKSGNSSLGDYLTLPTDISEIKLSSNLDSGLDQSDLYLKTDGDVVVTNMNTSKVSSDDYSGAALAEHKPHIGKRKLKKLRREAREKTKGKEWYDMPAPEMTEERQRDLELLQMRHVLDPKRFYKKNNSDALPKYFQIGTIQDTAADFYTDRVAKKDRKQTMVDELLADAEFKKYQKRRYVEIIEDKAKKQGKHFHKKKKSKA